MSNVKVSLTSNFMFNAKSLLDYTNLFSSHEYERRKY